MNVYVNDGEGNPDPPISRVNVLNHIDTTHLYRKMRARCPRSQGFSEVGPSPFLWVAAQAGFHGILGEVLHNRIVVLCVANEPVKSDCAIPYAVG